MLAVACGALAVTGCSGLVGGPGAGGGQGGGAGPGDPTVPGTPQEATETFSCDESPPPDGLPLRRLSSTEYARTVADLLVQELGRDVARGVLDEADDTLGQLPEEPRESEVQAGETRAPARFGRLVQDVSQTRVDAYYDVAIAVGEAATRTDDRLEALVGRCATNADAGDDGACLDAFVERFGGAAYRAPLDPDERAFLRDDAYIDGDRVVAAGIAELVSVILLSPRFLYHFELGDGEPTSDGLVALDGHELASRLSYHFWGTMPDEELVAAAERGDLDTDEGYEAQVDRLLADPRAAVAVETFFAEWLGVADLQRLDEGVGVPLFDAFFDADEPSDDLHRDMVTELVEFASHTVLEAEGTLADLFLSTDAFPRTAELADLYGVPRWRSGSPPISLPNDQRAGLLTRAAFLAIPSVHPHPILRGVAIRRHVICDELPNPPADLLLPEIDPTMSSREFVEEVTASPSCQGCHREINPLGFSLGNYDALGRYITHERLLDESGTVLDEPAVDASSQPRVSSSDDLTTANALELSGVLATSPKVEACFARQYFRFTHRRMEDVERDGCALERLRETIAEGGTVLDVLKAAALDPEFRARRVVGNS